MSNRSEMTRNESERVIGIDVRDSFEAHTSCSEGLTDFYRPNKYAEAKGDKAECK